jgi:FAD-dependent urate hydroxylase
LDPASEDVPNSRLDQPWTLLPRLPWGSVSLIGKARGKRETLTMGDDMNDRVLIVGAGIAGAATAMLLKRIGVDAVVFEARPEPNDYAGAFLNLMPNGMKMLRALGLEEAVTAEGARSNRIVFHNQSGRAIGELDNRDERTRYDSESVIIKRGALNRVLREAALDRGVTIRHGHRLVGVRQDARGVTANFENGAEEKGSALLGADGIHSAVRAACFPSAPRPEYLGLVNSGGFSRTSLVPPSTTMHMTFGRRGFFGYQSLPTGEIFWFSNSGAEESELPVLQALSTEEWKARLLEIHGADHEPIPSIIKSATGPLGVWPTSDLPFLPAWHRGRVCLIGDAAHATSPSAGQGASMALEDAVVLARCFRDLSSGEPVFIAFEQIRKERVQRIIQQARRNGSQKAAANPIQAWFRDRLLGFFVRKGVEANRWIYEYDSDWDEPIARAA